LGILFGDRQDYESNFLTGMVPERGDPANNGIQRIQNRLKFSTVYNTEHSAFSTSNTFRLLTMQSLYFFGEKNVSSSRADVQFKLSEWCTRHLPQLRRNYEFPEQIPTISMAR
jgi:hypothetical protein